MKYPQLVSMPSAVSDWLEEQLEARGIEAVVYARYILSLLHSDPVDVIYPDEDLHFSHLKKEVRRSSGGRKRLRRSSEWWKYGRADAEKLKRSAAVECLMSASDQTCGIESLIDELCEKLKEIKNDAPAADPVPLLSKKSDVHQQVSPQELAQRYYAAFPPLGRNSTNSPATLLSLIPKWTPSPKKKIGSVASKHANRSSHCEEKLHSRADSDSSNMKGRATRQRCYGAYFSGRNYRNKERNVAKSATIGSMDQWDLSVFSKTPDEPLPQQPEPEVNNTWSDTTKDDMVMFADLPVDITELLDGDDDDYCPTNHDDTVAMMNLANMRNVGFIPYGATSSIWSIEASLEDELSLEPLDRKFSSISIGQSEDNWSSMVCDDGAANGGTWNYRQTGCAPDDDLYESLTSLNHSETGPFVRANRKLQSQQLYNPFAGANEMVDAVIAPNELCVTPIRRVDSDDLLTSVHSHFKPINDKIENCVHGEYADGATFYVSNSLEQVTYRRTESGGLYVETDFGVCRRYGEYRQPDEVGNVRRRPPFGGHVEFVLKFIVRQNDKGCQTDNVDDVDMMTQARSDRSYNESDALCTCARRSTATNTDYSSTCSFIKNLCDGLYVDRPDSGGLTETMWKPSETVAFDDRCDNNNSVLWNSDCLGSFRYDPEWNDQNLRNIWSAGEVCHTCLWRPPSTLQQSKLREDISQDGDQLLSDLSSAQKSYMDSLPGTEMTCDISEMLSPGNNNNNERKRRHSLITAHSEDGAGIWSFASRLEEDCLIQMSTLPTLRSVTL